MNPRFMSLLNRCLLPLGAIAIMAGACARPSADATASSQAPAHSNTASVRLATDSFALHFPGAGEGVETIAMSATDSGYRYVERFALPLVLARAVEVDFDSALSIRRVRSETQMGSRIARSDIRYVDGRAEGAAAPVSGASTTPTPVNTFLPPGAFDGMALYPVILSRPWRVGQVDTLTIWDSDERSITRQFLRITGTGRVQTPAGDFDAFRAELTTTQLPVTLWVSTELPHRLLKVGSASGETVLVH